MNMNLRKGLTRLWIVASLLWLAFSSYKNWNEIEYSYEYLFQKDSLERSFAEYASQRTSQLKSEKVDIEEKDKAALQSFHAEQGGEYGQALRKAGVILEPPAPSPRIKELQRELERYKPEKWHPPLPKYDWVAYIILPPILLLLISATIFALGAWVYAGFRKDCNSSGKEKG